MTPTDQPRDTTERQLSPRDDPVMTTPQPDPKALASELQWYRETLTRDIAAVIWPELPTDSGMDVAVRIAGQILGLPALIATQEENERLKAHADILSRQVNALGSRVTELEAAEALTLSQAKEIEGLKHERGCLADAILSAVVKAGLCNAVPMTGPELMMFADDLASAHLSLRADNERMRGALDEARDALRTCRLGLSIAAGWASTKPDSQNARDKIKAGLNAIRLALNPRVRAALSPSSDLVGGDQGASVAESGGTALPKSDGPNSDGMRCKPCGCPRTQDPCFKCGAALFKAHPDWEEPRIPDIGVIRALAKEKGYALAVHGSLERDVDLIAAPWADGAVTPQELAKHIAAGVGGSILAPEVKPLGRWSCNIQADGWFKLIDLSVCPRLPAESGPGSPSEARAGNIAGDEPLNPLPDPPPLSDGGEI